jgi:RND family efflux transporter MFP subunit
VGGYIRRMHVDVGDELRAGSLIAEIEVPELADDLAGAEATRQQLEAEIARAERDLERAKANAALANTLASRLSSVEQKEPGLVARQEIDEAQLKHDAAQAQVQAAEAALSAAKQKTAAAEAVKSRSATLLDFRKVTAPFSGVVTDRLADTGAMVRAVTSSASQPIVRLAQISRLRLVVPVPEDSAAVVHPGTPVEVTVAALGKTFRSTVSRRSNALRRSTSTMNVEIDLPNSDRSLLPGMFADAVFIVDDRPSVLTVPVQALTRREGKPILMVVDSAGQVAERDVRTGLTTETRIEITSGLDEGDTVIIGDRSRLRVGQRVETKVVTVS